MCQKRRMGKFKDPEVAAVLQGCCCPASNRDEEKALHQSPLDDLMLQDGTSPRKVEQNAAYINNL